jgi:hypothetical protein
MDGVCEWLDPHMLDIWLIDAPMNNNVEDAMKARFFLLWSKITTHDFNIYISFQILILFV